ncbi:MAG: hypothetical protein OXI74_08580 [Rhodospirillaceae bacterium]|nr:hypothetical protein [Rhodospirillaceae bacterium]
MLVQNLNDRRRAVLLHYADEVMRADGRIHPAELVVMDVLRNQIEPGVKADHVAIEALPGVFKRRLARVSLMLELVGMGYANEDFDPKQSELLNRIAKVFGFQENGTIDTIEQWGQDQLALMKQAKLMGS